MHIVINSLRIAEVERKPYMDRASDTQSREQAPLYRSRHAGISAAKSWRCATGRGFTQIDLLNGSRNKVTEREYWAKRKGKPSWTRKTLCCLPRVSHPDRPSLKPTKAVCGRPIRKPLATAASFDEFSALLLREGVTV